MSDYLALLLLTFSLVVTPLTHAQSTNPSPPPAKSDYSQEAFVCEQSRTSVKFENDGTSVRDDSARIRIQSEAGVQRYGLLTFSYASGTDTFEIDHILVRKPDGSVVVTPPENIQDMPAAITREAPFYSDLREKHIAIKGLSIGDTLDFEIRQRTTKPLAPGQFWLQYNFSHDFILLQEQLEVSVPRQRTIKIKSSGLQPTTADADAYRIYTWKTSNLQVQEKNLKQDEADKLWKQVRGRFPQPDVLISSFQSWDELGHWYGGLQKDRVKPDADIQSKAAELTKGLTGDDAKILAIYKFVSEQYRYIGVAFGIGRYQPHSAGEVLANQYGDCKDKHTLLAALLAASGIKAYPALISAEREIDAEMPSPVEFDHVITVVPRSSGLLWLDSTLEVGPFGYLISALRDKHALVIWDDQPASLIATPADLPFPSTQVFHMDAKLDDSGTLVGNASFAVRGDLEVVLRNLFRTVPMPQWKELAQRISFNFGFGGEVSEVTASSPDNLDEAFHFSYKYTRKEYGDWPNHRILGPAPALILPPPADEDSPSRIPIWLGPHEDITFRSELELPKGFTLEAPATIHLHNSFADFDATYALKDGRLLLERRLRTTATELPSGTTPEYRAFYKKVQDDYSSFIPLISAASPAPDQPNTVFSTLQVSVRGLPDSTNAEALRLEQDSVQTTGKGDLQSSISSLYRAVAADPRFTRAWILLGTLLATSRQTDASADAFQKAIAADPNQPVSYKVFAYFLMDAKKFDQAVPVWQNLGKLAPDDVDAPSNLGLALYRLKRYDEAAAAFENALKLKPDRVNLRWQLASSYIHSAGDEKISAALQKLFEVAPGQLMLNNVAYELVEADKQLPLALEYAQKAVHGEEEASTKVELSKLKVDDLFHPETLSAYWDTLGWVQNRLSAFEVAEKNLNAAWRMSQDGTVALHLCRVYEREHRTQAAIQTCRAALHRLPLGRSDQANKMMDEARALLEHLSPGASKPTNMNATLDQIIQMRTFKLPRLVKETASAEFFVLLATDPSTSTFKAQDVKFISGSEKLKNAGKTLTSIDYKLPSPDGAPARVVRRGTLGCYEYSGCEFVLFEPDAVRSLE